ncbi:MAG TPA: RagB/SusD family nutrient uptake outer membrane protein [Gemmatimonadaceae bacterium]|nr:RagB/SusD family nutrient uptake outer membrane protein [Gemmatimonadaceae bacterium]
MKITPLLALSATAFASMACYDFHVTDPNAPTTQSVYGNPTRANMSAAALGMFDQARQDMESYVWRLGSMGREGVNLSGNNQPDYQEPYYGPLSSTQFGGSQWGNPYIEIRLDNLYDDAVVNAPDLSADEKKASVAFGETQKALALFYVIQTRAQLGAPVNVDVSPTAAPAPFVGEDSVYRAIIGLLADARSKLNGNGAAFPFPMPPGYANASSPQTFAEFTQALAAKAWVFRATDVNGCKGAKATCYTAAMNLLDSLFNSGYADTTAASFYNGVYFDFSPSPGDLQNGLSDPLNGNLYFALDVQQTDAQLQTDGVTPDARVGAKIVPATVPQILSGFPIHGTLKYSIYLSNGAANPAAQVPIIRDEELVLLRAEAELGLGNTAAATNDLNHTRTGSGGLKALDPGLSADSLLTQLIYERRYSLMWEQGTRWIDARRYGRLATIEANPDGLSGGHVPPIMPVPASECTARGLGNVCTPTLVAQ